jgi:hypothetical protein
MQAVLLDRMRLALMVMALMLGLLSLGTWTSAEWSFRRAKAIVVLVVPGRALHVEVWPLPILAERFSPYDWYYAFSAEDTTSRWVGLWYQDNQAGTRKRLAAFVLPRWPLTAATVGTWLTLLALSGWRRMVLHQAQHTGRSVAAESGR